MSSSPPSPHSPSATQSEEDEETAADLPMTLTASVILENLPRDAHSALLRAGDLENPDGSVRDKGNLLHHSAFNACIADPRSQSKSV